MDEAKRYIRPLREGRCTIELLPSCKATSSASTTVLLLPKDGPHQFERSHNNGSGPGPRWRRTRLLVDGAEAEHLVGGWFGCICRSNKHSI